MKKVILALVVFSTLLLIGCNNNSLTDPVSPQLNKVNDQPDGKVIRGEIPLDRVLVLPGLGNTYYQLKGNVNYTEELTKFNPDQITSHSNVKLDMKLSAILSDTDSRINNSQTWNISSDTEDLIYVSEEGFYVLLKSYTVLGRKDDLKLICKFYVTKDGVGLNSVELKEQL